MTIRLDNPSVVRFCTEHKMTVDQLRTLMSAADRAYRAGVRECNQGRSADPYRDAFEAYAKSFGFTVFWPGLYPSLRKGTEVVYLPGH